MLWSAPDAARQFDDLFTIRNASGNFHSMRCVRLMSGLVWLAQRRLLVFSSPPSILRGQQAPRVPDPPPRDAGNVLHTGCGASICVPDGHRYSGLNQLFENETIETFGTGYFCSFYRCSKLSGLVWWDRCRHFACLHGSVRETDRLAQRERIDLQQMIFRSFSRIDQNRQFRCRNAARRQHDADSTHKYKLRPRTEPT